MYKLMKHRNIETSDSPIQFSIILGPTRLIMNPQIKPSPSRSASTYL